MAMDALDFVIQLSLRGSSVFCPTRLENDVRITSIELAGPRLICLDTEPD